MTKPSMALSKKASSFAATLLKKIDDHLKRLAETGQDGLSLCGWELNALTSGFSGRNIEVFGIFIVRIHLAVFVPAQADARNHLRLNVAGVAPNTLQVNQSGRRVVKRA